MGIIYYFTRIWILEAIVDTIILSLGGIILPIFTGNDIWYLGLLSVPLCAIFMWMDHDSHDGIY